HIHNTIHRLSQGIFFGDGVNRGQSFKPFVEITVMKSWSFMYSLLQTCSNFKIPKSVTYFRILIDLPHMWHHRLPRYLEPFGPKTLGPLYCIHINAVHCSMSTLSRIDQCPLLGCCSSY